MEEEQCVTLCCSETEGVTQQLAHSRLTHWLHIDGGGPAKLKIFPIRTKVISSNNECESKNSGFIAEGNTDPESVENGAFANPTEKPGKSTVAAINSSVIEDDEAIEFFNE